MATAKDRYRQLVDALNQSKENRDLMDRLVKYSRPVTSRLNEEPINEEPKGERVWGAGGINDNFYPHIFQKAWDREAEEEGAVHNRARQKLREADWAEEEPDHADAVGSKKSGGKKKDLPIKR